MKLAEQWVKERSTPKGILGNLTIDIAQQIQNDAIREGMRRAVSIVQLAETKIYVGSNPIREGIKRGLSQAQIEILSYMGKDTNEPR